MLPPLLGCTLSLPQGYCKRAKGTPRGGNHVPPHLRCMHAGGFLKALSPAARRNSLQLCLTFSAPLPFCLLIFLLLALTLSPVFSVLFLSATFVPSHEHLSVLLSSVSHAHFCFSSPSISFPFSTLPPKKKLPLLHVLPGHLLPQGPPSPGTGEGHTQPECWHFGQFDSTGCLLPSVLVNEELAKSFREDEGPTEKVRVVYTQCVTSV